MPPRVTYESKAPLVPGGKKDTKLRWQIRLREGEKLDYVRIYFIIGPKVLSGKDNLFDNFLWHKVPDKECPNFLRSDAPFVELAQEEQKSL